jgi:hypothetical protein
MSEIRIEKVNLPIGGRVPLIAAFGLRIGHSGCRDPGDTPQYDFATQRTVSTTMAGSKCWDDESRGITLFNSKSDYRGDD